MWKHQEQYCGTGSRNVAGWATSVSIHSALLAILASFGTDMATRPERPSRTVVGLVAPSLPLKPAPRPAPLRVPELKYFRPLDLPKVQTAQTAQPKIVLDAPVVAASASPFTSIPLPNVALPKPSVSPFEAVRHQPPTLAIAPRPTGETPAFANTQPGPTQRNLRAIPTRDGAFGDASAVGSSKPLAQSMSPAGFGDATATAASPKPLATIAAVAEFGDASAGTPAARYAGSGQASRNNGETPIEILFQPRPVYTEEARRLKLEGQVLVEAILTATGEIRVLKIVRGLGHGLDESALAAVNAIRFRPARRHGQPVDAVATIRMNFELAF